MRTSPDLVSIRDSIAFVGRMSDSVFRVGPLNIGVDGVLSWIPGLGEIYSTAAAGFILMQGYRAGVDAPTLIGCGVLLAGRTVITAVPLAGPLAADLFTAHRWAARIIVRAIDAKLAAMGQATAKAARGRWSRSRLGRPATV